MRPIDADSLRKVIHCEYSDDLEILEKIDNAPTIKTFTLADIEEQYRKGLEKGLEEARPHGEWIYHKYDKDFECSMCHYRFDEDEFGLEIPQENGTWVKVCVYNFCPNCGADMRKEGESE